MTSAITTTLNAIREHSPCGDDWEKLLKYLGKTKADDEPLKFSIILESNGIEDALWCLRVLPEEHHGKIRHLAADYAERVLHIYEKECPDDKRPREAIQAARDYADGKITKEELDAAGDAAGDARDAAWDAGAAARDAAGAARAAAMDATGSAGAAWAAAWAAARAAAGAARAAGAAARDAAGAARAARAAAMDAAMDAWAAAWAAENKIQGELLIKYFG